MVAMQVGGRASHQLAHKLTRVAKSTHTGKQVVGNGTADAGRASVARWPDAPALRGAASKMQIGSLRTLGFDDREVEWVGQVAEGVSVVLVVGEPIRRLLS